ncbi:MAG: polysaccharide deacetylase family protein, partial [Sulfurimonas sp.]|nr:polysaccharide deacetylase family protein [Sulfurimonas sp.]
IDRGICPWTQILNRFLQYRVGGSIELPNGKIRRIGNRLKQADFVNISNEINELDNNLKRSWIDSLAKQIPPSKITKLMNWDQIRECAKQGIHIGSHGMSHMNLSKIDDKDALSAEIIDSKKRILDEVGQEPLIFAFPKGSYSRPSMEVVRNNGYKVALLCGDMVSVLRKNNRKKDFYIFPRINICRANWKEEDLRLLGFHQRLKSCIKRTSYILPGE